MRFKAILAEEARKRYPLSILIMVMGVLVVPFPYLFIHYGLEQYGFWWTALGICIGIAVGCLLVGLGSLVEDIHDISMHTMGFDLIEGELPEDEAPFDDEATEDAEAPDAQDAQYEAPTERDEQADA